MRGTLVPLGPIVNKTLYLPDDEAGTWEKARRLASDHLSPVILDALKEYIMTKEAEDAEAAGFKRIELEFEDNDDNHLPKRKAFRGKWIIAPENPSRTILNEMMSSAYAVAVTAKGNVVVYSWKIYEDGTGEFQSDHRFLVFPSFEKAAENGEINYVIREAMRKRGIPVEELDI
jgi:hypothetical protein